MLFPASSSSLTKTLEAVHKLALENKDKVATFHEAPAARKLAAYLVARNIPLSQFKGRDLLSDLAEVFQDLPAYGKDLLSDDVKLMKKVSLFKHDCSTINECARQAGIIGVLAGFLGEDCLFIGPNDPACVNWYLPDKDKMKWAAPRYRVRGLPKVTDDDRFDKASSSYFSDSDNADEEEEMRVAYVARMLFKNAVLKYCSFQQYFPSEGFAVEYASGGSYPSHYFESDDEDFLPRDVTERINTKLHFDPPQGYALDAEGGNRYFSYHSAGSALPPLSALVRSAFTPYTDMKESIQTQLESWTGPSTEKLESTSWIQLYIPQVCIAPRNTIKIALDFSAQWLFHKTGALTTLARGAHRWRVYYINTDYSYAALSLNNNSVIGVVVESGAFSASMTRLQVGGTEDKPELKYTVLADRGFLRDRTVDLDSPLVEIDGKKFAISFEYVSEWVPTGPGLAVDSPDQAGGLDAINTGLIDSDGEKFSPLAAYHVTIKEV